MNHGGYEKVRILKGTKIIRWQKANSENPSAMI